MQEIKFGIVGTGRMAATMMSAFAHLDCTKVVAVASADEERADRFAKVFNVPKYYVGVKNLFSDRQIDAVYIANQTESHAQTTIAALQAGKAVLCEKPIGISAKEIEAIAVETNRSGILCMEAMWTLFLPAYRRMLLLTQDNVLGKPFHLYSDFGYPVSNETYPRLFTPSAGSGVLLDRGVYPVVTALKLFGSVERISGEITRTPEGVDALACLQLRHQGGSISQLAVSMISLLQNRAVLSFDGGCLSLEPPVVGAEKLKITQALLDAKMPAFYRLPHKASIKQRLRQFPFFRRINALRQAFLGEFHSYKADQYLPVLQHFCDLYRAGKQESEIMPLSLSTDVLRVIEYAKTL